MKIADYNIKNIYANDEIDFSENKANNNQSCNDFYLKNFANGNICLNISNFLKKVASLYKFHDINILKQKYNINKSRKIFRIVEFTKQMDLQLFEKESSHPIENKQLYHEYFLALNGINNLRYIIPNFSFTFFAEEKYIYNATPRIKMYQEKIDATSLKEFIVTNQQVTYNPSIGLNFLSIFFQVIFSLIIAQDNLLFTHYDLHQDNIVLRKNTNNENIMFPVLNKTYIFNNSEYISTIIDFGTSTIYDRNENELYATPEPFLQYGYLNFFSAGTDIFRFLTSIYNLNSTEATTLKKKIITFMNLIFNLFYKIDIKNNRNRLNSDFYNISGFSDILYKTPTQLFNFLMTELNNDILEIFEIDKFPFGIVENNLKNSNQITSKASKNCYNSLFCSKLINYPKKSFFKNNLILIDSSKNLNDILEAEIEVPCLRFSEMNQHIEFVEEYKWFLNYYEYYYNKFFIQKQIKDKRLYKNFVSYFEDLDYLYKIIMTNYQYVNIHKKKFINENDKYWNSIVFYTDKEFNDKVNQHEKVKNRRKNKEKQQKQKQQMKKKIKMVKQQKQKIEKQYRINEIENKAKQLFESYKNKKCTIQKLKKEMGDRKYKILDMLNLLAHNSDFVKNYANDNQINIVIFIKNMNKYYSYISNNSKNLNMLLFEKAHDWDSTKKNKNEFKSLKC